MVSTVSLSQPQVWLLWPLPLCLVPALPCPSLSTMAGKGGPAGQRDQAGSIMETTVSSSLPWASVPLMPLWSLPEVCPSGLSHLKTTAGT